MMSRTCQPFTAHMSLAYCPSSPHCYFGVCVYNIDGLKLIFFLVFPFSPSPPLLVVFFFLLYSFTSLLLILTHQHADDNRWYIIFFCVTKRELVYGKSQCWSRAFVVSSCQLNFRNETFGGGSKRGGKVIVRKFVQSWRFGLLSATWRYLIEKSQRFWFSHERKKWEKILCWRKKEITKSVQ